MTTLREAAQQALEALRGYRREIGCHQSCDAERGLESALAQQEPEHRPGCALLQIPSRDCDCRQEAEPIRAQKMRDAGYTRRPTLREMARQEKEDIAQNLQSRLDAALLLEKRRQEIAQPRREAEQEPVAWYDGRKFYGSQEAASLDCANMAALMPLYTTPPRREAEQMLNSAYESACGIISEQDKKLAELEAMNRELLEILREFVNHYGSSDIHRWMEIRDQALAAIAKAEKT